MERTDKERKENKRAEKNKRTGKEWKRTDKER